MIDVHPDEVAVRIHTWHEHESLLTELIDRLIEVKYIYSAAKVGDVLTVQFPADLLKDRETIDSLLDILREYQLY